MGVGIVVWLESKDSVRDQPFSLFLPRSALNDALETLRKAGHPKEFSKKATHQRDDLKVRRGGNGWE